MSYKTFDYLFKTFLLAIIYIKINLKENFIIFNKITIRFDKKEFI